MQESESHDRSVHAAFRAVADDEAGLTASPSVEARLLAEVRSCGATRRRRRVYASAVGVAAALIVVTALAAGRSMRHQSVSSLPPAAGASQSEPGLNEVTTGFLPLT